jgi:Zn-dependent M28 family amino/carboxypeptidase
MNREHRTNRARRGSGLAALLAASTALVVTAATAVAAPLPEDITSSKGFRKGVTLAGVREHQAAFQAISDANGGNRVAGSAAYDASAEYVIAKAEAAGLDVTTQEFPFIYNNDNTLPVLQKISPNPATYVDGVDFASMTYSGNGDFTGAVSAVDLMVPPTGAVGSGTSGCDAADFAGFIAGNIALMQRGTCTFAVKAQNAQAAGAVAAVIFNDGYPGRTSYVGGTLGAPGLVNIPVVGTTYDIGVDWSGLVLNGSTGTIARVRVDRVEEERTTVNVFAETPTGDPDNVVVIGAHLDSVARGPGINDNGSGSAGILEIAETYQAQKRLPRNKLRFAWWGAEELGLLGSNYYVNHLTQAQKDAIALNLNFDMIGSPNYVRFVYDGDNSAFAVGPGAAAGPDGSGQIEKVFHDYFGAVGLASSETPFSGRSDYGPFIAVGIPAGGLFTGAEGAKTAAEAAVYGGTAGVSYDPCYHLACDTFANNSNLGLDEMTDAAAHTVLVFSKQNFTVNPLVNPSAPVSGSTAGGEGGGLHADHDEHEAVDR